MSNYITTNIRLPEEDYYALKEEAFKKRQSLSAVIREKIGSKKTSRSKSDVEVFMRKMRKLAKENAKYLKGVSGVEIIRDLRDNAKW